MACTPIIDTHTYTPVPDTALEDDSFTLSYSFVDERWRFAHDYIPDASLMLRNQKLIQFYKKGMYEMNVGRYGVYFGVRNDCYMVLVFNPDLNNNKRKYPFIINSINWNTDIEDWYDVRQLEETWTSISLHNSFQGTRDITIIPFKENCDFESQYGVANTRLIKNRWEWNYAFNEKDSSQDKTWKEVRDKFISFNTEIKQCDDEDRVKLMDDYIIIKLTYNNLNNYSLYFYELNLDIDIVPR